MKFRLTFTLLAAIAITFTAQNSVSAQGQGNAQPQTIDSLGAPEFTPGQRFEVNNEVIADDRRGAQQGNPAAANGGQGGAQGGLNQLQNLFGGGGFGGGGFGQQTQQNTRLVRAPFKVAFQASPRPQYTARLNQKAVTRFTTLPRFSSSQISASITNRVMTLSGVVKSDSERKLAERIARMEPGVSKVQNLLAVAGN